MLLAILLCNTTITTNYELEETIQKSVENVCPKCTTTITCTSTADSARIYIKTTTKTHLSNLYLLMLYHCIRNILFREVPEIQVLFHLRI